MGKYVTRSSATPTRDCQRVMPMTDEDIRWSLDLYTKRRPSSPGFWRRLASATRTGRW